MRLFFCGFLGFLILGMSGCEPAWRRQFPNGAKLYEHAEHRYFGKVVAFEATHDFHNGAPPTAAILIEPADEGQPQQWGSCSTCAATFEIEGP